MSGDWCLVSVCTQVGDEFGGELDKLIVMKGYQKFIAWQRSIDLVEAIYLLSVHLPDDERFGLTSQMRRAAVSVPANIAEGYGRSHRAEFRQFLSVARGSLHELQTHLIVAGRLKMITKAQARDAWTLSEEIGKTLTRTIQTLGNVPEK